MSSRRSTRPIVTLICVALGVLILDQLTKAWAVAQLRPRMFIGGEGPIEVIGSLLRLTYTQNTGASFSMGTGYTWVFSIVAIIVAVVIIRSARELGSIAWAIALGGLLGGLLGNLMDRFIREPGIGQGYVVDFIQLPNFPVFNVADMSITCSAVLMVVLALKGVDYRGAAVVST